MKHDDEIKNYYISLKQLYSKNVYDVKQIPLFYRFLQNLGLNKPRYVFSAGFETTWNMVNSNQQTLIWNKIFIFVACDIIDQLLS